MSHKAVVASFYFMCHRQQGTYGKGYDMTPGPEFWDVWINNANPLGKTKREATWQSSACSPPKFHIWRLTYKYAEMDNELVNNVLVFLGWIKHIAPHGIVTVFAAGDRLFSCGDSCGPDQKKSRKEKQIDNRASWEMIKVHKQQTLYNNNDGDTIRD